MTEAPLVSVVIPCVNGLPSIAECLEALARQADAAPAQVLVVDRCGEDTRAALRHRFPDVEVVAAEARTTIPALRAMGVARARGRMVAFLEDHCNADPSWLHMIERAHREGRQAVGGAVVNGSVERVVDWAAFLCEYARFAPPLPRGAAPEITGNNSAYDRALLERLSRELGGEVWESFLHARMRELGVPLFCEPDLLVSHKKRFGFAYFLSQRYHYSRSFAGMRLAGARPWKRLAYACATALLPALLLARMIATLAPKRAYWRAFAIALPVILVFLTAWALGEAIGALLGPGDSLERVE